MMDQERKLRLMRLMDGELDPDPGPGASLVPRLADVEAAYVGTLSADRALLRALFPATTEGQAAPQRVIESAFAARGRRAASPWRVALPIAASILTAIVVGAGAVLVADRRAEDTAGRLVAAFARDQQLRAAAFTEALDRTMSGRSIAWQNPDSGSSGTVTPLRSFRSVDGRWCREYEQFLIAPGGHERITGIACRVAGGWLPTTEPPSGA